MLVIAVETGRPRDGCFVIPFRRVSCFLKKKQISEWIMEYDKSIKVLYSFPHKLGAQRICYAAWQHVQGLASAGAEVLVFPGVLHRELAPNIKVSPTLSRGRLRVPYKLFGRMGACVLHDWIVSRRLAALRGKIDLIHTFPLGSLRTLEVARQLGIPTVLERCNAHTEYAYSIVAKECERLGVAMPAGHEHAFNAATLRREEAEYQAADYILCPSAFVARTFLDRGFQPEKLMRFQYGCDSRCHPNIKMQNNKKGLTVLFAAGCAPRKGLHYALEAWLQSSAHHNGTFLVVGEFIPGYAEKLSKLLNHPSVKRLGFRKDLPDVMRDCDILVLPSIEEGSALVTYDARVSGCVLLVSDASGAVCEHMENALVHSVGDVKSLTAHFTMLDQNRSQLEKLRICSLRTANELTWNAAGEKMLQTYRAILTKRSASQKRSSQEVSVA
jgi:glycosyltransferase involved in cell wall biosynthesis